jgi:hypothetical protein
MLCMAALLSCLPTRRLTAANSSRCDLCRRAAERVIARGLNKGRAATERRALPFIGHRDSDGFP